MADEIKSLKDKLRTIETHTKRTIAEKVKQLALNE